MASSVEGSTGSTSDLETPNPSMQSEPDGPTERPSKRRRLSDSSDDSKSFPPPKSFSGLSRIKKKAEPQKKPGTEPVAEADPVTAKDAFALGINRSDSPFANLGLAPWLVGSLSTMAIKRPTAIQGACIPEILKGRDCIGGSRTGSGKTIAFAAPILHKWAEDPFGIFAVVLTPTR